MLHGKNSKKIDKNGDNTNSASKPRLSICLDAGQKTNRARLAQGGIYPFYHRKMSDEDQIKKLGLSPNLGGDITKISRRQQQIIIMLSHFNSQGILPTYKAIGKHLRSADKGDISRDMTKLRKLGAVVPKLNKLSPKGRGWLGFLGVGLTLKPVRVHNLMLTFDVLSYQHPFKHGTYFSSGRHNSVKGYKGLSGEAWEAVLYVGRSRNTLVLRMDSIFAEDVKASRRILTQRICSIRAELASKGIKVGDMEIKTEELAHMGHPLAKWFFKEFGIGGTDQLWVDNSMGIPELETKDAELMQAIETMFDEVGNLVAAGREKLGNSKGGLKDLDDK